MIENIHDILDYDPDTGLFTWKYRSDLRPAWNTRYAGKVAGCLSHDYVAIAIDNKKYLAHRLAYLWMTGSWPPEELDHIDMDRSNNRWANLREASKSQNAATHRFDTVHGKNHAQLPT